MNVGKTLFSQVMRFIPWTNFTRIVDYYPDNAGVRRTSCAKQFRVMAFAQLTWRESLRDIEVYTPTGEIITSIEENQNEST